MVTVFLQASGGHQHCFRLVELHKHPGLKYFSEEGLGTQASEVTCPSGTQLVKLEGVTTPQEAFLAWFRGSQISRHFLRIYWCTECSFLDPQDGHCCYDTLLSRLRGLRVPDGPVRISCCPRSLERAIGEKVGWKLDPHDYATALAAVAHDGCVAWGLYPGQLHYAQSPEEPSRLPVSFSHAIGKLSEAIGARGWDLSKMDTAIDLGAAPGSWTFMLAQHAKRVIAIDPADMDAALLKLPNVVHLRAKAPEGLSAIQPPLQPSSVDMIVSDMNVHPDGMMAILAPMMHLLRPEGLLVLTLKFQGRGKDKSSWKDRLVAGLGRQFRFAEVIWLLTNTGHERTFLAEIEVPCAGAMIS